MSDMKCPFCGQELRKISATSFLVCDNCNITGFDKLWQELIRTRKALDVAVNALTEYTDEKRWDWERCYEIHSAETAKKALEQITALEQKDVK